LPRERARVNPIKASVKVATAPIASVIVDVEVYDSANRKVFQKYYEGQDFTAGQTRSYSTSWTPAAAGTYTVKIGVFKAAWAQQYHWNNAAGKVVVSRLGKRLSNMARSAPASARVGESASVVGVVWDAARGR
jgi:hypothetical protein